VRISDPETALSLMFTNTKRKRRSVDLVTLAEACRYLVGYYGSQRAVADKLGLSSEMIREFLTVLKLPIEVQEMVSQRKIDRLDIVRELASLTDRNAQIEAARIVASCSSKDIRDIKRLVKVGGLPVEQAKKAVMESKPKGLHIFLIDVDDQVYEKIKKVAEAERIKPPELVKQVVMQWVSERTMAAEEQGDQ